METDIHRLEAELQAKRRALQALDAGHQQAGVVHTQPLTAAEIALADVLRRRREATLKLALAAVDDTVRTPAGLHRLLSAFQAGKITSAKLAEDGATVESLAQQTPAHLTSYAGIVAFGVRVRCHLLLQRIAQGQGLQPTVGNGWDCLEAARFARLKAAFDAPFELLFLRYDVDGEVLFHLNMDDLCLTFKLTDVPTIDLEHFLTELAHGRQQQTAPPSTITTPLLSAITPTLSAASPGTRAQLLSASAPPGLPTEFGNSSNGTSSTVSGLSFGHLRLDSSATSTSLDSRNIYSPFNPASYPVAPMMGQPLLTAATIPDTQAAAGWPSSTYPHDGLGYPGQAIPLLTAAPPPGFAVDGDGFEGSEGLDSSLALPSDLFNEGGQGGHY